jgi:aminobenzoyl-glutamate utilization protein B
MSVKNKLRGLSLGLMAGLMMSTSVTSAEDSVLADVNGRYDQVASLAQSLWNFAEVGYQETKSSKLMQDILAAEGFNVTAGVAGIPTAFVAEFKNGDGPVIAILAEMDALPGINQDATPNRNPIPGKAAGHACGHNLFGAGSVEGAIAIKKWMKRTGTMGTIRLLGTPAEEGGSGKVYMVRAGLFKDVDFALHWHPGNNNSASARTTLANRSAKFRFSGVSAHAAGAPENARSALDGVEAMNDMVNMMREHVPQETRIHYVITKGGLAPNVVPDFAEVFYYLRHPKAPKVIELWKRLEDTARGAALGTGTTVKWEIIHGNHAVQVNETLSKMVRGKLQSLGGISYTAAEQKFATTIYKTLNNPKLKIGSEKIIQPYGVTQGYGSTDVGDVSMAVPTVGFSTASYVPGTSAHSWQSVAAGGMSIGFKGAHLAAKTLAVTAQELFLNKKLRDEATAEFHKRRGPNFVYLPVLGDRKPPLDYRN